MALMRRMSAGEFHIRQNGEKRAVGRLSFRPVAISAQELWKLGAGARQHARQACECLSRVAVHGACPQESIASCPARDGRHHHPRQCCAFGTRAYQGLGSAPRPAQVCCSRCASSASSLFMQADGTADRPSGGRRPSCRFALQYLHALAYSGREKGCRG